MNRLTILVLTIWTLTALTAGVAFAVSGTGRAASPVTDPAGGQAAPATSKAGVLSTPSEPAVPVASPSAATPVAPAASPPAAKPTAPASKTKAPKTITGAVVHDPDDCGDTCSDSKLDADDCGVDDCSDDGKPSKSSGGSGKDKPGNGSGASTIDDDGDGEGGDCGDADGS
jgi:hypothetical protein